MPRPKRNGVKMYCETCGLTSSEAYYVKHQYSNQEWSEKYRNHRHHYSLTSKPNEKVTY